jgi:hypothetical protein
MNKVSKVSLITVGGLLGIATSLTVLGAIVTPPAKPVAKVTTTTSTTVTVTATPAPTAAPTPVPTAAPTAVPTPTPRAAACPSGFHNGTPGDTYSGCFANPTPTPAPSDNCQMVTRFDDGSVLHTYFVGYTDLNPCTVLKSSTETDTHVVSVTVEYGDAALNDNSFPNGVGHSQCHGNFVNDVNAVISYSGFQAEAAAIGQCTQIH